MRLDEYAFGIRHDSPGLRAPRSFLSTIAGHGDPAGQWMVRGQYQELCTPFYFRDMHGILLL